MISTIKRYILTGVTSTLVALVLPGAASAQFRDDACLGITGDPNCATAAPGFESVWENVLNLVSFVVGAIAVLMLIIGGIRFVVSNGDPGQVQSARNTVIYSLVGVVIALVARGIVTFVLNRV